VSWEARNTPWLHITEVIENLCVMVSLQGLNPVVTPGVRNGVLPRIARAGTQRPRSCLQTCSGSLARPVTVPLGSACEWRRLLGHAKPAELVE
jgi:hypothetical protein